LDSQGIKSRCRGSEVGWTCGKVDDAMWREIGVEVRSAGDRQGAYCEDLRLALKGMELEMELKGGSVLRS
jgi:hypothetical protein